ncbi:MAG TPA: hypothetical protein VIQ79_09500, partial [Kribbella sp.]
GQKGANGRVFAGIAALIGLGGSSPFGSGARPRTAAGVGNAADLYGSGGGGAFGTTANLAGGAGSAGCILARTVY